MSYEFHPTVLREYDIRGVIGETLGPDDARAIGRGFATLLREAGGKTVATGYDGRLSSPTLEHALIEGLTSSGCDVVRVGMGPTPMLYFAEASLEEVDGGIQITGSHNPANYNGFKMVFQGRPFFGDDIATMATGSVVFALMPDAVWFSSRPMLFKRTPDLGEIDPMVAFLKQARQHRPIHRIVLRD